LDLRLWAGTISRFPISNISVNKSSLTATHTSLYASLKHRFDFFFQIGEDRGIRNLKGSFLFSVSEKHSFLELNKKALYVPNTYTTASTIK